MVRGQSKTIATRVATGVQAAFMVILCACSGGRATVTDERCEPLPVIAQQAPDLAPQIERQRAMLAGIQSQRAAVTTYVMLDQSTSYARRIPRAVDIAADTLGHILSPGDFVIGAWIGADPESDTTTFFPAPTGRTAAKRVPQITVALPSEPQWDRQFDCSAADTNETEGARNKRLADRDAALSRWVMQLQTWLPEHQEALAQWSAARDSAVGEFVAEFRHGATASMEMGDTRAVAKIIEAVYESQNTCAELAAGAQGVRTCHVLLFTDLIQAQIPEPSTREPSPVDVDVVAALVPITTMGEFDQLRTQWDARFRRIGARNVHVFSERASDGDLIGSVLASWLAASPPSIGRPTVEHLPSTPKR